MLSRTHYYTDKTTPKETEQQDTEWVPDFALQKTSETSLMITSCKHNIIARGPDMYQRKHNGYTIALLQDVIKHHPVG